MEMEALQNLLYQMEEKELYEALKKVAIEDIIQVLSTRCGELEHTLDRVRTVMEGI